MKSVVVIPAYNEENSIGKVVSESKKYVEEVIVVDDGSVDHTAENSKKAGAKVIVHKTNIGYGAALQTGIKYALKNNADVIITLDGDGQHDPNHIPKFVKKILSGSDIVIGSRLLMKSSRAEIPSHRRFGIKLITKIVNLISQLKMTDLQGGFRAYRRTVFEEIEPKDFGMGFSVEVPIKGAKKGFRFEEVPIFVSYKKYTSTHNPLRHGLAILFATFRYRFFGR